MSEKTGSKRASQDCTSTREYSVEYREDKGACSIVDAEHRERYDGSSCSEEYEKVENPKLGCQTARNDPANEAGRAQHRKLCV